MTSRDQDHELVDLLRTGRARMPRATDDRLQRAIAHAGEEAATPPPVRRSLWLGAAAVLAGVAVILGVSLWANGGSGSGEGVHGSQQDPQKKDRKQPAPQAPRPQDPEAEVTESVEYGSAASLLAGARYLGVFELTPRADGAYDAKTIRWILAPDAPLENFILLRSNDEDERARAGLAFHERRSVPEAGGVWLLDIDGHGARDGLPLLKPANRGHLRGIPITLDKPTHDLPTARQRLLGDLLRSVNHGSLSARRCVTRALFQWEGPESARHPGKDTLWVGLENAEPGGSIGGKLLNLSRDRDPGIRLSAASGIPGCAGPAGRRALVRLSFDGTPAIRRAAVRGLARYGVDWLEETRPVDSWWTVMFYPPERDGWLQRARRSAKEAGIDEPIATWQRQLQKPRHENHLLGAIGLGTTGLKAAVDVLITLENHGDPRVRAAAAGSRIRLGDDQRGWQVLEDMLLDEDVDVAAYALDVARTFNDRRALALYDNATDSEHAYIRALAAVALHDVRALARHLVLARRQDLYDDASPMVRAAARAY